MTHITAPRVHVALRRHEALGFTIIELVAVIVVVGILAAFAVPRFVRNETFDARSFTDQNLNMLRYAQKLAIAQNRPVFALLSSNRIALCFTAACSVAADQVRPPSGTNSGNPSTVAACGNAATWFCEGRPSNVTYTPPTAVFYFNALGRPFLATDVDPVSTFTRMQIPISDGGPTRNVIVEAETGYVHL